MIFASVAVVGAPGAALLWWLGAKVFPAPGSTAVAYITLAPIVLLVGFFLLNSLFIGVTSWASETGDREWWARAGGWVGAVALTWLALHGLVFWVPQWIEIHLGPALKASVAASGGVLGFIAAKLGASARAPAFGESKGDTRKNLILTGAAVIFFALLSCGVSVILDRMFRAAMLPAVLAKTGFDPNPWLAVLNDRQSFARFGLLLESGETYPAFASGIGLTLLVMFGGSFVMGWFVNINRFSLHSTYRNRLVRAYLGAPRTGPRPAEGPVRYRRRRPRIHSPASTPATTSAWSISIIPARCTW